MTRARVLVWLSVAGAVIAASVAQLLAYQDLVDPGPPSLSAAAQALGSTVGVGGVTVAMVYALQRWGAQFKAFGSVPTFMYVCGVALGLTYFAHHVIHTLHGENFWLLTYEGAWNAFATIGGYQSFTDGRWKKPLAESDVAVKAEERRTGTTGQFPASQ